MTERLAFIDWMKAIGMFLIVFGHVVGGQVNLVTPPIYHKQWGVAFFLFLTGFTLARETRPVWRVVVNRLFEILLIPGAFALLATLFSFARGGRGQLSNYWPFLLGANVLINHFPANPTTWFVGTYMHVIALWALGGRRLRPSLALLGAAVVIEVFLRTVIWTTAGAFIAYMVVPNWLTVLLLGLYAGQRDGAPPRWTAIAAAIVLLMPPTAGLVWSFDGDFPFRRVPAAGEWAMLSSSLGVTCLYVGGTWLAYATTSLLPRSAIVEFLARQTLVIFVAHMPLFYALQLVIGDWPRWARALPHVLLGYIGLAVVGAVLYQWLRPTELREWLIGRVGRA